jgi:hypothetical protein
MKNLRVQEIKENGHICSRIIIGVVGETYSVWSNYSDDQQVWYKGTSLKAAVAKFLRQQELISVEEWLNLPEDNKLYVELKEEMAENVQMNQDIKKALDQIRG